MANKPEPQFVVTMDQVAGPTMMTFEPNIYSYPAAMSLVNIDPFATIIGDIDSITFTWSEPASLAGKSFLRQRTQPTPQEHLPPGYPLPTPRDSRLYQAVWNFAWRLHAWRHDFTSGFYFEDGRGFSQTIGLSAYVMSPIDVGSLIDRSHYCDCYESAYSQLFEFVKMSFEQGENFVYQLRCAALAGQPSILDQDPAFLDRERAIAFD